ncbi:MAG: hypothetical protein ACREBW_03170 [Candidatus Micrarchaeaceae archaeon]
MSGRRNNQGSLNAYAFLRARPGQLFHYSEVAEAIKADPKNTNAALVRAVASHPDWGIERSGSGHYRYLIAKSSAEPAKPSANDAGEMFEKVGTTMDGNIIVRNESGVLYRLADMV